MSEENVPDTKFAEQAWHQWNENKNPTNLATVLRGIKPMLDKQVARHSGVSSAVLGGEAKRLAIQAIQSYDPARGTALSTHVFNHLLPLGRHSQELTRIIRQPRNAREDAAGYLKGINNFKEENNREPTDAEIRDMFGLDKRGLARLHQVTRYEFAEGQVEEQPDVSEDPRVSLWADYVYHDLDPQGQAIMDHKLGRNGRPILSTDEVAAKLNLHPTYINRRASNIAGQILEGVNSSKR